MVHGGAGIIWIVRLTAGAVTGTVAIAQINRDETQVRTGGAECRARQERQTHQQVYRWCVFSGPLRSSEHSSWHKVCSHLVTAVCLLTGLRISTMYVLVGEG